MSEERQPEVPAVPAHTNTAPEAPLSLSPQIPLSRRPPLLVRSELLITDWMWAVLLGVASIGWYLLQIAVSTAFFFDTGGPSLSPYVVWGTVGVLAMQAVPILFRTGRPILSFWLVFAGFLGCVFLTVDRSFTISATLLFSVFTVTASTPLRSWVTTLSMAIAIDMIAHVIYGSIRVDTPPTFYVVAAIIIRGLPVYAAPILAGLLYATQRRREQLAAENTRALQQRAEALRLAADAQLAAAVASERNAMARELHDLSAHHLSGLLLQATGARQVLRTKPGVAEELLDDIRDQATETLLTLREVVVSLRDDEPPGGAVAAPTLSRLPDLIDSVRTLHPALDLRVDGDIEDLTPATSLACYRIIQESLTNARRHAPGAYVRVHVQRRPREVELEVLNTRPDVTPDEPAGSGHHGYGVLGMRERVTMLGGTFEAAPSDDGGWRILAIIPTERRVST